MLPEALAGTAQTHSAFAWSGLQSIKRIRLWINVRRLAVDQFGHQLAGSGAHRQPQHIVTGCNPNVAHRRALVDERFAIPGHRSPAKPFFFDRFAVWFVQIVFGTFGEHAESRSVHTGVVAGELHG